MQHFFGEQSEHFNISRVFYSAYLESRKNYGILVHGQLLENSVFRHLDGLASLVCYGKPEQANSILNGVGIIQPQVHAFNFLT